MYFTQSYYTRLINGKLSKLYHDDHRDEVLQSTYMELFDDINHTGRIKKTFKNLSVIAMAIVPCAGVIAIGLLVFYPRFYDDTILRTWFKN